MIPRDVEVEDPAPGGFEDRRGRAGHPGRGKDIRRMDRGQDRGAHDWPGGHPEERQRADDTERPWAGGPTEQV
jgi:hypothetical protein